MRISGNYLERYIFSTLPWMLCTGLLLLTVGTPIYIIMLALMVISLLITGIDLIGFRRYKLSTVILLNGELLIAGKKINTDEITAIRPHSDIAILSIVFEIYLADNSSFQFMDKPTLLYKAKNKLHSKSLDILFAEIPGLKDKLRAQKYQ